MKIIFLLTLTLLNISLYASTSSPVVLELKKEAHQILNALKEREVHASEVGFSIENFDQSVKNTKVIPLFENQENFVKNGIIYANVYWWQVQDSEAKKMMATHLHLLAMGVDDAGYGTTLKVFDTLKITKNETSASPRMFRVLDIKENWKGQFELILFASPYVMTKGYIDCSFKKLIVDHYVFSFSHRTHCQSMMGNMHFKIFKGSKIFIGLDEDSLAQFSEE